MAQVQTRDAAKLGADEMRGCPCSGRTVDRSGGIRLHPVDQLGDRADRQLAAHRQRQINRHDLRDGRKIDERIVAQVQKEVRLKRDLGRGGKQQCLVVPRGILDSLSADASACASTVVYNHSPVEPRLQLFGEKPGDRICRSTR